MNLYDRIDALYWMIGLSLVLQLQNAGHPGLAWLFATVLVIHIFIDLYRSFPQWRIKRMEKKLKESKQHDST